MAPPRIDGSLFSPDIQAFIRLLLSHDVRYLVVGEEAVIFHGHARLTGDVDLFFAIDRGNARRLYAALDEFWGGSIPGIEKPDELLQENLILQFGTPPNRIDLINGIDGVSFEEAWQSREEAVLVTAQGDYPLPYIGIDALIKNKRASGRPKDLDDFAYLERARTKVDPTQTR